MTEFRFLAEKNWKEIHEYRWNRWKRNRLMSKWGWSEGVSYCGKINYQPKRG
jgi:hypothetical protein